MRQPGSVGLFARLVMSLAVATMMAMLVLLIRPSAFGGAALAAAGVAILLTCFLAGGRAEG